MRSSRAAARRGLGAGEFDGGERAFDDLGVVVIDEALGSGEGLFLDADVFAEGDEVVVEAGDTVDGFEELLLKDKAGDAAVEGGDADEAAIDFPAAAAEQRLGKSGGGAGGVEGVVLRGVGVEDLGGVADEGFELAAEAEALLIVDAGADVLQRRGGV